MAEWTKAVDCKSIRFISYIGSNPIFFSIRVLNTSWVDSNIKNYNSIYRFYFKNVYFMCIVNPRRINCFFHFFFSSRLLWLCTTFTLRTLILLFFKTLRISYFFNKFFSLLQKIFSSFRHYFLILVCYRWFLLLPRIYTFLLYKYRFFLFLHIPKYSYSYRSMKNIRRVKKKILKRIFVK